MSACNAPVVTVLDETSVPWCNDECVVPLVHERFFRGASNGHSMPVLLPPSGGPFGNLKAMRVKVCLSTRFLRAESLCCCLSSRHNAQKGGSLVDHQLHRDLTVGLQELLLVLILVHDGPIRLTLRGTGGAEDSVR